MLRWAAIWSVEINVLLPLSPATHAFKNDQRENVVWIEASIMTMIGKLGGVRGRGRKNLNCGVATMLPGVNGNELRPDAGEFPWLPVAAMPRMNPLLAVVWTSAAFFISAFFCSETSHCPFCNSV
jgi:hypothetical protein